MPGYCYVAACENEERKFIISLLGCGWPNNKTYKWKDAMKLLEYGKANFHKETYWQEPEIPAIPVKDGTDESSGKESGKENQGKFRENFHRNWDRFRRCIYKWPGFRHLILTKRNRSF